MKFTPGAKRAAIFVYYDADGVVDDYIPVLMAAVREHCSYLLCVVNGDLLPEAEKSLCAVSDEVILRANEGLDITGYKEGYLYLRDKGVLQTVDELLFFNQTVFGPIYPFAETFAAMDGRELDFWGMTRHPGLATDLSETQWSIIPYGYMPPHIQSYFFAVRRSMFDSDAFRRYWDELPVFKSYVEAVALHEICFTKHFEDLGFAAGIYVDAATLEPYNEYPLMGMPVQVLKASRCPVIKRKSFLVGTASANTLPHGGAPAALYAFLRDETDYDVRLIAKNLTRTAPVRTYTEALAVSVPQGQTPRTPHTTTAVILVGEPVFAAQMAGALFGRVDELLLLCADEAAQAALRQQGFDGILAKGEGLCALGAALPTIKSEFLLYLDTRPYVTADDIRDMDFSVNGFSCLRDVDALAAFLEKNPVFGMALPLPDSHLERVSRDTLWPRQRRSVEEILEKAGLSLPLDTVCAPARMDGGFFARTALLAPLASMAGDGAFDFSNGVLPAADYLPALLCQAAGALCAFAADESTAVQRVIAMQNQLDALTRVIATPKRLRADELELYSRAVFDFYYDRRYSMTLEQAYAAPLTVKEKLWIVLRVLLSQKAFGRLYRFTHSGHDVPPVQQGPDPLD